MLQCRAFALQAFDKKSETETEDLPCSMSLIKYLFPHGDILQARGVEGRVICVDWRSILKGVDLTESGSSTLDSGGSEMESEY